MSIVCNSGVEVHSALPLHFAVAVVVAAIAAFIGIIASLCWRCPKSRLWLEGHFKKVILVIYILKTQTHSLFFSLSLWLDVVPFVTIIYLYVCLRAKTYKFSLLIMNMSRFFSIFLIFEHLYVFSMNYINCITIYSKKKQYWNIK